MADNRTPAIRKPKAAAELEKLHPIERSIYRVFEFVSSIRLAMIVLPWLIIECIAGALLESRVNTDAARYFVYGSSHFYACLGLLTLNIFCAALIRFPWKRYQTGFVVTHIGLLIIMFGSFLTLRHNVDALLVASKFRQDNDSERWANRAFDPHKEYLEIVELDPKTGDSKSTEHIPLQLGPYTWGDKIFGVIPWKSGHTETHTSRSGDEYRIKEFYCNIDREDAYVPAEDGLIGADAMQVKFGVGEQSVYDNWISPSLAPRQTSVMGIGDLFVWKAPSQEDWQHFSAAFPKPFSFEAGSQDDDGGLYGWLSLAGKANARLKVDELKAGKPIAIPGTKDTIEVLEYYADAKPGTEPDLLKQGGSDPNNPGLKIRLTVDGKSEVYYCLANDKENAKLAEAKISPYQFKYRPVGFAQAGYLALSVGGKHGVFSFSELQAGPVPIVGTDYQVELVKYLPDARVDTTKNELVSQSDQPRFPAAQIRILKDGKEVDKAAIFVDPKMNAFANSQRKMAGSLFAPRLKPTVELCVSPKGQVAYRAYSSSAFLGGGVVELNKKYPVWPIPQLGQTLALNVVNFLPNARLDARLFAKPLEPRENGHRGIVVEVRTPQGKATVNLNRHTETVQGGFPVVLQWPDRVLRIRLAHEELTLPFSIRLEDFIQPNIPGSRQAAMYSSIVKVKEGETEQKDPYLITMNRPLRYTAASERREGLGGMLQGLLEPLVPQSYALYQTSIAQTEDGPMSTFTVSRAPGTVLIYSGVIISVIGMFLMFYMGGYFRKSKRAVPESAGEGGDE